MGHSGKSVENLAASKLVAGEGLGVRRFQRALIEFGHAEKALKEKK